MDVGCGDRTLPIDRLAVATDLDTRLLDVATLRETARVDGPANSPATLAFTHDGTRLVTAGWDTTALVWSVDEAVSGDDTPGVRTLTYTVTHYRQAAALDAAA